jgi:hypothetical protein
LLASHIFEEILNTLLSITVPRILDPIFDVVHVVIRVESLVIGGIQQNSVHRVLNANPGEL